VSGDSGSRLLRGDESVEVEGLGSTALLTRDEGRSQCGDACLLVLQQPEAGSDDLARRAVASRRHFSRQELREVIVQADRCVLRHAEMIPIIGNSELSRADQSFSWITPPSSTVKAPASSRRARSESQTRYDEYSGNGVGPSTGRWMIWPTSPAGSGSRSMAYPCPSAEVNCSHPRQFAIARTLCGS